MYNDPSPLIIHKNSYYIPSLIQLAATMCAARLYCSQLRAIMFLYVSILSFLIFCTMFSSPTTYSVSFPASISPWMIHIFLLHRRSKRKKKNLARNGFIYWILFSALIVLFAMLTHVVSLFFAVWVSQICGRRQSFESDVDPRTKNECYGGKRQ